jgi:hypothetical protein
VKNLPKMYAAKHILCQNQCITFSEESSRPKFLATALIFEKLPKENYRPIGENSPNLVTLLGIDISFLFLSSSFIMPRQLRSITSP